ncbi:exosome non-catalytic core subunit rrp40 [Gonapodya sp. JEL0774]|nr:exosome non-catalytic core subunit rrp40 [Gonapodya sp. JEL0774]
MEVDTDFPARRAPPAGLPISANSGAQKRHTKWDDDEAMADASSLDNFKPRPVIPGDQVPISTADSAALIRIGPGLHRELDGSIMVVKAGVLCCQAGKDGTRWWVDSNFKRYVPVQGEPVVGQVTFKSADYFRVDIGAAHQAQLSALAFEGATKRNRPPLEVGSLVYARVSLANRDMEPELECVDQTTGRAEGFGELKGGFVVSCSLGMARSLLLPTHPLLPALGARFPFETAVGLNGRVWISASTEERIAVVARCIVMADRRPIMTDSSPPPISSSLMSGSVRPLIVVHAGAGFHHESKRQRYIAAVEAACRAGMRVLLTARDSSVQGTDAVVTAASAAATAAVAALEDDAITNAGSGSNLTLDGRVECDASVMCGKSGAFGALGAVPGVKNPVLGAHVLMAQDAAGALPGGRVPPMLLAGKGAWRFCKDAGLQVFEKTKSNRNKRKSRETMKTVKRRRRTSSPSSHQDSAHEQSDVEPQNTWDDGSYSSSAESFSSISLSSPDDTPLLTPASLATHSRHLRIVQVAQSRQPSESQVAITNPSDLPLTHDTVGALALDHLGNLASSVSSGGISLKVPGRVGEAALWAAGCWATNPNSGMGPGGIAVATTGTGEQVVKAGLAKGISHHVATLPPTVETVEFHDSNASKYSNFGQPSANSADLMVPSDPLSLQTYFRCNFLQNHHLGHCTTPLSAGAVVLRYTPSVLSDKKQNAVTKDYLDRVRSAETDERSPEAGGEGTVVMSWAHTTPTMCVGWFEEGMNAPIGLISKRGEEQEVSIGGWIRRSAG